MTVEKFKEIMLYNEPSFGYNGKEYSICHPDAMFYARCDDWPADQDLAFQDVDDLLERWVIEGRPLKDILPEIAL